MCGRYTLAKEADDIAKRFNIAKVPKDLRPNYNTAPMQTMPVITEDEAGKRQIEFMRWGIHRIVGKDIERDIINTRADKAFGGFWRRTVLNHRCLIPATSFFEWKGVKPHRHPYVIHPKGIDLYAFAGIWDISKDKAGHEVKTYSIMTTEPNKEMSAIHNRAPVMLHPDEEASWLELPNDESDKLGKLLFPFEDNGLEIYQASDDVNSPRNNNPGILEPAT